MEGVTAATELRRVYPRVLARLVSQTRKLDDAEDAVQEAILRALVSWPRSGTPDSPEAWLVTVAANAWRDGERRRRRETRNANALTTLAEMSPWVQGAVAVPEIARGWKDDLLRLLFLCASPALEAGEGAALALATVLGLSVPEIAAAFGVPVRTMEQRLTRARRRLRDHGEDEAPPPERARERLGGVLASIYLLFNEGYWSHDDAAPIRRDLCRVAIGLSRSLHAAIPDVAETTGLVALLLLHDARHDARVAGSDGPVRLSEQDRSRWNAAQIAEATALLKAALVGGEPGPFQLEAAIAAVHCEAVSAERTDWAQIATLYAMLERVRPTAAVRVNRAFAVSRAEGPEAGLMALREVEHEPYAQMVRGVLLDEAGRGDEALAALERALDGARNAAEAAEIRRRMAAIHAAKEIIPISGG